MKILTDLAATPACSLVNKDGTEKKVLTVTLDKAATEDQCLLSVSSESIAQCLGNCSSSKLSAGTKI